MNPFGDMPVGDDRNPFGDRPVSTITGKPIPTGQEAIQQTGKVWKTAGPIAGDIAMTALAPEVKALGWMGNLALRSAMSGAGSFGGSIAGQKMSGEPIDYDEAKKQGLLGLAGEPILTGIGAAFKRTAKPVLDFFIPKKANTWVRRGQQALAKKEVARTEEFIMDIAPDIVKKQDVPLNDVDLKLLKAKEDYGLIYDKYEQAIDAFAKENNGLIHVGNATQLLNNARGDKKAYSVLLNEFGFKKPQILELKPLLEGSDRLTPKQIKNILATINKNFKEVGPTVQANKKALKDAFLDDLGQAVGAKDLKKEADILYKNVSRFEMVQKLFKGGMGVDREGKTFIYPYRIAKKIYSNKKKLMDKEFGVPELWPKLKAIADHFSSIFPTLQKIGTDDMFDIQLAWAVMPNWVKKTLGPLGGMAKGTVKATGKAAIHMAGEELPF